MSDVTIFAPSPILTITVEDHPSDDEIHVHAGGQGVWQARMLLRLGRTVSMCCTPNTASHRGIRESALAPFGIVQTTLSEREEHHIRLAVEDLPHAPEPGTDAAHLADGWVTVTGLESVTGVPLGLR